MSIKNVPELHHGLKPPAYKRRDDLQGEIDQSFADESDCKNAVQKLRESEDFPSYQKRHAIEKRRYEVFQNRSQICESSMAFCDYVIDELREKERGLPPRQDAEQTVADRLNEIGFKVSDSGRSGWVHSDDRMINVNALVLSHPLVLQCDGSLNMIRNNIRNWQDFKFDVIQARDAAMKQAEQIKADAVDDIEQGRPRPKPGPAPAVVGYREETISNPMAY